MRNPNPADPSNPPGVLIGVVGPCASGKTTLIAGLRGLGYNSRQVAQEHSYVRDMWRRITNPEVLIFLDASYPVTCQRRNLNWSEAEYAEQQQRLTHAKEHASFYLNTDRLTIEQVLEKVVRFLQKRKPAIHANHQ